MAGTLLQQVRVVDPVTQTDEVMDVWMAEGVFRAIAPQLPLPEETVTCLDGTGKILMPGLIDLYSHSSEPGYEPREPLAALLQGGIAGGFTRVGILPDTDPVLDTPGAVRHLLDLACESPQIPQPRLLPWAALTQADQGQQMTELAAFTASPSLPLAGFAAARPIAQPVLLRRLLEYLQPLQRPIALWPCDQALAGKGLVRDGALALVGGLPGVPVAAETTALAALLELVREIGTPVHVMRVSTARSVELIAQAKADGVPVSASTTWMHLRFSTQDTLSYDPNLRLEPPLGNPGDQAALLQGVQTGAIAAIAVDHQPYTYEEKTVALSDAPPGGIGLELALAVLWQHLVAPGQWRALELVQALSLGPAQCLQLPIPSIAVDHPVEAVLFDPDWNWTVNGSTLRSPAHNTPFWHQSLQGRVAQVWIDTATYVTPRQAPTDVSH